MSPTKFYALYPYDMFPMELVACEKLESLGYRFMVDFGYKTAVKMLEAYHNGTLEAPCSLYSSFRGRSHMARQAL